MMSSSNALRAFASGCIALVTLLSAAAGYGIYRFYTPVALPTPRAEVYLQRGHAGAAAGLLREAGVLDPTSALLWSAASRFGPPIRAGEYAFVSPISPIEVLRQMRAGSSLHRKVTFPEGITAAEAAALLTGNAYLTGEVSVPEEGALLPETYVFERGDERKTVIARAAAAQHALLQSLWAQRAHDLPLRSPEEAVVLASIVEKETGKADERPRIAAAFLNRLRRGMRLQSDPTAVYGLTRGVSGHVPTSEDVRTESPYNTYLIDGLPPTPIACPGRAALTAVLHPDADRNVLYFVADGTGGHAFSASLPEHNAHVVRLRMLRGG